MLKNLTTFFSPIINIKTRSYEMYIVVVPHSQMNARDAQGQTPLHLACERGDVGCVRELLEECQARTDIKDKNGETPMHCAAKQDSALIIEVRGQLRAHLLND